MPEEMTQSWQTMTAGAHPWEGLPFIAGGRTEINAMVNMKDVAAGKTDIGYTLTLNAANGQLATKDDDLSQLEDSGRGGINGPDLAATPPTDARQPHAHHC